MTAEVRVTGADQMKLLGAQLKAMGDGGKILRRELLAEMRAAEKVALKAAKDSAMANLPSSGGLNEYVASSRFTGRNRLSGNRVGIELVATKGGSIKGKHDLAATDAGAFRHPVFSRDRKRWTRSAQQIQSGWWSKPMVAAGELLLKEIGILLDATAEKIARF